MKATIKVPKEIEIKYIRIDIPLRHIDADSDHPIDIPFFNEASSRWIAMVDIDTGKIANWPQGQSAKLFSKVRDEGIYRLMGPDGGIVAEIDNSYVPNRVVPGEYGDYVELDINEEGTITNWPKKPDVSEFFKEDEDE